MDDKDTSNLSTLTADIVSAYVSQSSVGKEELGALISGVHAALKQASIGKLEAPPEPQTPAVPIKKSVTPDYIISLEDGRKFKSLKRHLQNKHGMTPDEYRSKWGLPRDYPMVAPNYAKARSELAKAIGLGQGAAKRVGATPAKSAAAKSPKRRNSKQAKGRAAAPSTEGSEARG